MNQRICRSFAREVVVAGSPFTPPVCEVVDLEEKPVGTIDRSSAGVPRTIGQ
jgi:hypothetical protein